MNEKAQHSFGLSLAKCWQSEAGALIFQASITIESSAPKEKGFLVINPANHGSPVLFFKEKPLETMHANGAAAIIRKHCPSARIDAIALGETKEQTSFLRLTLKAPNHLGSILIVVSGKPDLQIDVILDGQSLVRLQSQKTFTVRKPAAKYFMEAEDLDREQFHFWLRSLLPDASHANVQGDQQQTALSLEHRQARDKIARRLKTLRKTLAQDLVKLPSQESITNTKDDARLLSSYLWLVKPGSHQLELDAAQTGQQPRTIQLDPDKSAGENLERLYIQLKKLERALILQGERTKKLKDQIDQFEVALTQIKNSSAPLPQSEVNPLLATLGLAKVKNSTKPIKLTKTSKSGLGRKFLLAEQVLLTLGRDAKESDQIVKSARSSDWWVHIAGGGRGSHVIISGLPSKVPLPAHIAKAAGILALHFSERSNACEGEVYCTRRQFIRKQKGLAPGLWLVDKSETVLIRYTPSDVADIFSKEMREGIQRHKVSE
jgi:hypothetical protein